jgi:hypothetical protein
MRRAASWAVQPQWSPRTIGASALAATLTPMSGQDMRLRPAELRTLYVRVHNDGDEHRPWGLTSRRRFASATFVVRVI